MKELQKKNVNKFKLKIRLTKAVIKLINIQFIQSRAILLFTFIFSIIFITLFGYLNMFGMIGNSGTFFMGFIVGIVTFEIFQTGTSTLPGAIVEFRSSVLLKRIGSTPIKSIDFISISILYYFFITVVQLAWIILWLTLCFGFYEFSPELGTTIKQNGIHYLFKGNVDWFSFIVSMLYFTIFTIVVGIFIASISKNAIQSQTISMVFFFIGMLLSGQLIPMSSIDGIPALKYISLLTPFRSINTLAYVSWNIGIDYAIFRPWENIVFEAGTVTIKEYVIESWAMWYSWFSPIIFSIFFIGISMKYFKWSKR